MGNYKEFETIQEQVNFLKEKGDTISCKEVLEIHALTADEVIETEGQPLIKTKAAVEKLIGDFGYEFYTTFEIDAQSGDILDLVLISKFVLDPPCYSTKLLRCIAKAHNLTNDAPFVFLNAEIKGEKKVIIKIADASNISLYDLSQSPY